MKKINESFICIYCWKSVPPANKTCRNHCPYCFVSMHVDWKIPGDRNTDCKGKMIPINYEIYNGNIKINFKCIKCNKIHANKFSDDDNIWELDSWIKKHKYENYFL